MDDHLISKRSFFSITTSRSNSLGAACAVITRNIFKLSLISIKAARARQISRLPSHFNARKNYRPLRASVIARDNDQQGLLKPANLTRSSELTIMASLKPMPQLAISSADLAAFGLRWQEKRSLARRPPHSSGQLGLVFDRAVGKALAEMLGGIPIGSPNPYVIRPGENDVVEVGPVRIVGGVRPQNFDVGYRPDGVRFAFDSKTLNDTKSVGKNYQNMINDLATEATTVHTRFPYAIVALMVVVPEPCLGSPQRQALTRTLERLTARVSPLDSAHKAEAISLVLWDPFTGDIDQSWPTKESPLRIEAFSGQVEKAYMDRYKGLPPHDSDDPVVDAEREGAEETSVDG